MRILHTADWHMNHKLGRKDMTVMIECAIEQVAAYLAERSVDVLVIAGDLFSGREGREQLKSSIRFLKETFGPFLARDGSIIAISGNHDNESFYETLRDAFDLVAPIRNDLGGIHASGRLYIAPNPRVLTLQGRDGLSVQFVLMPYPTPRCFLDNTRYLGPDDRNAAMADTYRNYLRMLLDERIDKTLPSVLVSHAHVRGVESVDLFRPGDEHEILVEPSDLPLQFAYGAFGHVHCRLPLTGAADSHFWYSGSLMQLDAGERDQDKSVTLIEIGSQGIVSGPTLLPIHGPGVREVTVTPADIPGLRASIPDHETALVKYTLRFDPDETPDPYPLHLAVREALPNWYESAAEPIRKASGGAQEPVSGGTREDISDVSGSVLAYLREQAAWDDRGAKREDVIALAAELLADDALMETVLEVRS